MFGAYRTFLAVCVVASHLVPLTGRAPLIGWFSVHGFFILSGYLMTHVMTRSYGYTIEGRAAFAINRMLRLLPSYWVVLALSVALVGFIGNEAAFEYHKIGVPETAGAWVANATLIYPNVIPHEYWPRLSPPTWALTVELVYYALICLGISRTKLRCWLWFGLGLSFHILTGLFDADARWTYFSIPSGALPFAIGALLFHYRDAIMVPRLGGWTVTFAFIPIFTAWNLLVPYWMAMGLGVSPKYVNLLLNACAVLLLAQEKSARWDKFVGDFSYHFYISHLIIGATVAITIVHIRHPAPSLAGFTVFALTLILCAIVSLALTFSVDRPIERLRRALRDRRPPANAPPKTQLVGALAEENPGV